MTERKPGGMSFESWIDKQIREAEERGEFKDLPGAGKPLTNLGRSNDEMWWIRRKIEDEGLSAEDALPTPLRLRKEISRLPETVRDLPTERAVRDVVIALNERVKDHLRSPSGPQIAVPLANADEIVDQWRARRAADLAAADAGEAATQAESTPAPTPSSSDQRGRWWRRFSRRRRGG